MTMQARSSGWQFVTSNGGNVAAGVVMGEGGSITLKKPSAGGDVTFYYGAIGIGAGFGVKLPKLRGVRLPGAGGSSEVFQSGGTVYITPAFRGAELAIDDINGGCCFLELSGGAAWGGAAYAMAFGMNPSALVTGMLHAEAFSHAIHFAAGYLVFAGWNFGLQAGGSVAGFAGILHA